jgi:hypothetical protein
MNWRDPPGALLEWLLIALAVPVVALLVITWARVFRDLGWLGVPHAPWLARLFG